MQNPAKPDYLQQTAHGLTLLEAAAFTISTKDTGQQVVWSNPEGARAILRCPDHRIPGKVGDLEAFLDKKSMEIRRSAMRDLSWEGASYKVQYALNRFDGEKIRVEERGQRLNGKSDTISAVLRDISSEHRGKLKAAYQANHDPLTGLWNRSRLLDMLAHEQAASKLRDEPGHIAAVNLASLSDLNENYGYDTGDKFLLAIADRLRMIAPAPRGLARVALNSFVLLLPDCDQSEAENLIQAFIHSFSDNPITGSFGRLKPDISTHLLSISAPQSPDALIDNLLGDADISDESSPNTVFKLSDEIVADDILSALNARQLSIAYQPIVETSSRNIAKYECLLRYQAEGKSPESAFDMIVAAERLGLVHLLDRRALEIGGKMLLRSSDIKLAFNVSVGTISNEFAAESYLQAIKALGPAAKRVTLELTETLALDNPEQASLFAQKARDLGCRFAIDDFGAGHTSFRTLMAIEADILKIDGSLIRDIASQRTQQTFVHMIVDLAQTIGVQTVAEMVNSDADADCLKRLGVDYLQGYMFGKPEAVPA
jgi:diguanylate cyclase (GGDEF)-like protein